MQQLVQVSPRGQLTLPAAVRKQLGLRPGDALTVHVQGGELVLTPAAITPVELYSDERIAEFDSQAQLGPAEVKKVKKAWGL